MSAAQSRPPPGLPRAAAAWILLAGLAAGPADWVAQLILGYGLSSYACYPGDAALTSSPPQGWGAETPWLLAINLIALAATAAALAVSWRAWKAAGAGAGEQTTLRSEEVRRSRARFMALCGMLACGLFAVAILFDTAAILVVPGCWQVPR